jgi:hypothetical protein
VTLGYIAVLLFIIAFILRVTSTGTGVMFAPESLLLVGLAVPSRCTWRVWAGGGSRDGAEPGAGQPGPGARPAPNSYRGARSASQPNSLIMSR